VPEPVATIVFDGSCVLCNGWVDFLLRRDHRRRFRFAAMQGRNGRALLAAHGLDADDPASFLLLDAEGAHRDSDAVLRVITTLGGAWRLAGCVRSIPASWRDAAYRFLARNRYRWFGQRACRLPQPHEAARFLD
jgi:predicted DCC family thiol-disulfide oxidoreductase YuxK